MPMGVDNKFIKVVNEGDAEIRQVQDGATHQDMTYDYRYMFKMGVAVQIGAYWGEWKLA